LSISAQPVRRRTDNHFKEAHVKYAILIYADDNPGIWTTLPDDERKALMEEYMALSRQPGVFGGDELEAASTATTVRVEDGRTLTTDGPFAETKEVLGGFYLLEAADLDAALEFAARIPAARMGGAVEVRPIREH
jgi:hypothetical protein